MKRAVSFALAALPLTLVSVGALAQIAPVPPFMNFQGRLARPDGTLAFAAGNGAHAFHAGAFVWADSQNARLDSTAPNQFLIRAAGGVGIDTATPTDTLSLAGSADFSGFVGIGTAAPQAALPVKGFQEAFNREGSDHAIKRQQTQIAAPPRQIDGIKAVQAENAVLTIRNGTIVARLAALEAALTEHKALRR
jgi:hypothetical protein